MKSVAEICSVLESVAPSRWAFSFDHVGLQVGDPAAKVSRGVVALDRSLTAAHYAHEAGSQLLLTHHPLIFEPLSSVTTQDHVGKTVLFLARHGIAHIAAHTNWDSAPGGINDELAKILGLNGIASFGEAASVPLQKLVYTVPTASAEATVSACADAGAGQLDVYRRCAFISEGQGTFEPQPGANPSIGTVGERETIGESRIEMTVRPDKLRNVLAALRKAHPYEIPAIDVYNLNEIREMPAGRVGQLSEPIALSAFAATVDELLGVRSMTWGDPANRVKTIALVGGAADREWRAARRAGADVLITGEVKQHVAVEASESGIALIAAGHFATENPGARALCDLMRTKVPDVEWLFYEPKPGEAGRPF